MQGTQAGIGSANAQCPGLPWKRVLLSAKSGIALSVNVVDLCASLLSASDLAFY